VPELLFSGLLVLVVLAISWLALSTALRLRRGRS
jgi:hypothetical protein